MQKSALKNIDYNQDNSRMELVQSENLLEEFIRVLNKEEIQYCHWKSNFSLDRSFAGEIDLDILIERSSLSQILTILTEFEFKQATVKWGMQDPGIFHYYGFDSQTGNLVHIHLFSHVLTGESFLKSHQIPLEKMLLENTYFTGSIKTTSKKAELIIFILRNYIKYGSLLDLAYLLKNKNEYKSELNWLKSEMNINDSQELLNKYCPQIDQTLFLKCVETLENNGPIIKRIVLARRIRSRLKVYSRYSTGKRLLKYIILLYRHFYHRLIGENKNKMLTTGGAVIAFVGPEATGKSTLVSESQHWLSHVFSVKSIHAGKPPTTLLTYPLNILLPLVRKLIPGFRTSRVEGHVSEDNSATGSKKDTSLLYAIRAVALAWDRRALLIKAQRSAAKGNLIICDRYPSESVGAMDSPRLQANPTLSGLRLSAYNALARLEKKFYLKIPPPHLVLQLTVSLETAKRRNQERIKKGKEDERYLESRHRQNKDWKMSIDVPVYKINTEHPLPVTIHHIKKTIWESL
jgi:thymidylate kinase